MGYRRQQFDVDPYDPTMQSKYKEMRKMFSRVSPQLFMRFLDSHKEEMKTGSKSQMVFWAVPKTNFPSGLPAKIKRAEVCAGEENAPSDIDYEKYFVVDQCVHREQLGKGVYTLSHFTGCENKFTSSGGSNAPQAFPRAGGVKRQGDDLAADTVAVVKPRRTVLRENPSSDGSSPAEEAERPAVRHARIVKETLQTLKTNVENAVKSGVWDSANRLSRNSVRFWVEQTVGALEEMVRDAGTDRPQMQHVVCKFTMFLLQTVQDSDAYPVWRKFEGVFPRLIAAGGTAMPVRTVDEAKLLQNLAVAEDVVDTDGVSVLACAHFYNSKIYLSFVNHVASQAVKGAQEAATGAQRMEFLNPWVDAQGLDPGLATAIKDAVGLFDESKALPERIAFLGSNDLGKMAIHWDPNGVMGVAGLLFQEAPNLTGISFEMFKQAADAINEGETHEHIKNPVIQSATSLCADIGGFDLPRIMHHALHLRLQIQLPEDFQVPDAVLIGDIPKDDLKRVASSLKTFFAKATSTPPWAKVVADTWSTEAQSRKDAAAAAAAAKAAEVAAAAAPAVAAVPAIDVESVATGAVTATGVGETADAPPEPAAEVVWVIGKLRTVKFGTGNNPYNNKKARVTGVLQKHCHVMFMEGPGQGESKKIVKENLTPLEDEAPAAAAAEEIPQEAAEGAAAALTDTDAMWEDAGNVF